MKPGAFRYQEVARDKILSRRKTAVIAPPGSGKTRPIVEALSEAGCLEEGKRVLVLCSGPAIATWVRQIPQWYSGQRVLDEEDDIIVVRGKAPARSAMWESIEEFGGVAITNSAVFLRDWDQWAGWIKWDAIVADEYHKFMRNRKSKTYTRLLKMSRTTPIVALTTGSVINDDPSSMFTAFQVADPSIFRSYWKFVNTFCLTQEGPFGKEIIGVRNVQALRDIMDRYMAYIPDDVVADQLPEGFRYPIDVEMTESQSRVYTELSEEMIAIVEDELVLAANPLSLLVRLRQLLCCPKILNKALDMGGGYEFIIDQFEDKHPYCAIFVPFRDACDYIVQDLTERGYYARLLRGGMAGAELQEVVDDFRARASTGAILVCTIAYGESFDLELCRQSYFLGYDYDVTQNHQAEGRTRRAISTHSTVHWGYIRYTGTIDDALLQDMDTKFRTIKQVLKRPEAFVRALKGLPV